MDHTTLHKPIQLHWCIPDVVDPPAGFLQRIDIPSLIRRFRAAWLPVSILVLLIFLPFAEELGEGFTIGVTGRNIDSGKRKDCRKRSPEITAIPVEELGKSLLAISLRKKRKELSTVQVVRTKRKIVGGIRRIRDRRHDAGRCAGADIRIKKPIVQASFVGTLLRFAVYCDTLDHPSRRDKIGSEDGTEDVAQYS